MLTTPALVILSRWLQGLDYDAVRDREAAQPYLIRGKNRRLRGVMLAPDLCFGRSKIFYRILGDIAHVLPTFLVAEQYDVKALIKKFERQHLRPGAAYRRHQRQRK